jgi:hypothetical protein
VVDSAKYGSPEISISTKSGQKAILRIPIREVKDVEVVALSHSAIRYIQSWNAQSEGERGSAA